MKNTRSVFVNWTRPRILRCSTVSLCLSAAFSASSRLLDLKSEATRLKMRNISATIVADVKRFSHQINTDEVFDTHSSLRRALSEYVEHFHAERNHQGKGNVLLFPRGTNIRRNGPVQCRERLGGLLRYYHQEAA